MNTLSYQQLEEIPLLGNLTVKQFVLTNGLRVAIVVDATTPIFTYQTWFKVGSADEPAGRQGLAHLFEHMMFRKTSHYEMGEFERIVNNNGGTGINAYTSRDQTVYFLTFPNDKFHVAVDLEADRMRNLLIDAKMFETEKGAVITEKNRGLDDPGRYLWEEVYKLAYTKHNYRYSTIGEVQSIRNFSVEDAEIFYRNYYSPSNALIIVAGDVEPDAIMRSIAEQYNYVLRSLPQQRDVTDEPRQLHERASTITHPKATSRMLVKLWHVPNILHPDYPALATVGRLLASGKSAILQERILNKAKATEVFADAYMSRDLGTFEFFVQLSAGETFDGIETIFSEAIAELAAGKISEEQVTIVKNNLQREVYQAVTVPARLARLLGDSFIYTGDLSYQIRSIGEIEKVRREDVQRVITRYLLEGKSTTVKLLPAKEQ